MSGPEHNPPTGADPLVLLGWADTTQLLDQVVHAKPQSDALPLYVPASMMPRVREVQAGLNESLVQMPQLEPVELAQPQAASPEDMAVYNSIAAGYPAQPQGEAPWARHDVDGMVEALTRLVEAHSSRSPFHDPICTDAAIALRYLRGYLPFMKRMADAALASQQDLQALNTLEQERQKSWALGYNAKQKASQQADDSRRSVDARNKLNAAIHGDGAVIDDLETAVHQACLIIKRHRASQQAAQAVPDDAPENFRTEVLPRQIGGGFAPITMSAVRVTHIPTGASAESYQARSQHKNRQIAFDAVCAMLRAAQGEAP